MRCKACNAILTDQEATLKSLITREYYEMCSDCLRDIEEDVIANGEWNDVLEYYEEDFDEGEE